MARRHSVALRARLLVLDVVLPLAVCVCMGCYGSTHDHPVDAVGGGAAVPASQPVPTGEAAPGHISLDLPFGRLSVLCHEYLAARCRCNWMERADGSHVPCYIDPDDGTRAYVVPAIEWPASAGLPPGVGVISGQKVLAADDLRGMVVIELRPPIRYRAIGSGRYEVGYFEPAHRTFFRWRGVVRGEDEIYYGYDPTMDAISPVVPEKRIGGGGMGGIIDVPPPPDVDG